jgi:hypothetical protein
LRHAACPVARNAAPLPVAEHPLAGRSGSAVPTEFRDQGEPRAPEFCRPRLCWPSASSRDRDGMTSIKPTPENRRRRLQSRTGHSRKGHRACTRILRPFHRANLLVSLGRERGHAEAEFGLGPQIAFGPKRLFSRIKAFCQEGKTGRERRRRVCQALIQAQDHALAPPLTVAGSTLTPGPMVEEIATR